MTCVLPGQSRSSLKNLEQLYPVYESLNAIPLDRMLL